MDTAMGMVTAITTKTNNKRAASARWKLQSIRLAHGAGNAVLRLAQRSLFRPPAKASRILIFRTGSFGDSLCAIPAIRSIRQQFPKSRIDILTNTGHSGKRLVSLDQLIAPGLIDEVINYEGMPRRALTKTIRSRHYDAIIQLPQYNAPLHRLLRDMLVFRILCRIPAGLGWQWDNIPFFRKTQEYTGDAANERKRLLDMLQRNGIRPLPETDFALNLNEADHTVAETLLQQYRRPGKAMIALVPGAKRPQNRWPLPYFAAVCAHFSPEFDLLLLGGPDDRELAGPLESIAHVHSLCGLLTPMQNAWVMKQCALVLSNDTGPMHLAYAVGTPLVALFSARDIPGRWYPPESPSNRIFRSFDIPCSVCFSETCADNICMKRIDPETVIAGMEQMLRRVVPE